MLGLGLGLSFCFGFWVLAFGLVYNLVCLVRVFGWGCGGVFGIVFLCVLGCQFSVGIRVALGMLERLRMCVWVCFWLFGFLLGIRFGCLGVNLELCPP